MQTLLAIQLLIVITVILFIIFNNRKRKRDGKEIGLNTDSEWNTRNTIDPLTDPSWGSSSFNTFN